MAQINRQRGVAQIFVLLLILAGIVGGVYLVQQRTNILPKAQEGNYIQIVDKDGNPITETSDPNVYLKISLPPGWQLPQEKTSSLVKEAFAQGCPTSGEGTTTTFGSITYDVCVDNQGGTNTASTLCSSPTATKYRCYYSNNSNCISGQNVNDFNYECPAKNIKTITGFTESSGCKDSCGECPTTYTCGQQTYDTCDINPCQQAGATSETTFNCYARDNPNCSGLNTYKCNSCANALEPKTSSPILYRIIIQQSYGTGGTGYGSDPLVITSDFNKYFNALIPWTLYEIGNLAQDNRTITVKFLSREKPTGGGAILIESSASIVFKNPYYQPPMQIQSPTPAPMPSAETIEMKVLVLKYFPLDSNGVKLNKRLTDLDYDLDFVRKRVDRLTLSGIEKVTDASRYHGYKVSSPPALNYKILESKEFLEEIPLALFPISGKDKVKRPNYLKILNDLNICDYVDNKGVNEVWVWSYHTKEVAPAESNMSMGTNSQAWWNFEDYGDISNSELINDMPTCKKTYLLYNYNYQRDLGELLEDHGHQIESVMSFIDPYLWNRFVKPHGKTATVNHCGWTHSPPNVTDSEQYNWYNERVVQSDCEDWKPDTNGEVKQVSCHTWYGKYCKDNVGIEFKIWWMQNIPGLNNGLRYYLRPLRNWWEFIGDFDLALSKGKSLTE